MINLELPKKLKASANQAHQVAAQIFRPVSRKYDLAEHVYPVELDTMAAMVEGLNDSGQGAAGAALGRDDKAKKPADGNANGGNMAGLLNVIETCWGDVGLTLSIPYQGLGNSAIAAVATDEQLERFGKVWASMAITEPSFGSDSAAVTATAVLDGDEWVLNGEKIFVTAGERSTHIVVWASVDKSKGRAAIKSFVVPREAPPGLSVARSNTSSASSVRYRGAAAAGLPHPQGQHPRLSRGERRAGVRGRHADLRQHPPHRRRHGDRSRTGRARGAARDPVRGRRRGVLRHSGEQPACRGRRIPCARGGLGSSVPAGATRHLDGRQQEAELTRASISKAKAGRTGTAVSLKAVELAGTYGYSERPLLEKWARDSKILDIFEGTQQIQQLIVARRLLGKSSSELK